MTTPARPLQPPAVALLVMAAASGLVWAGRFAPPPSAEASSSASAPAALGLWAGTSIPVDSRARAVLETDDVSLMEYRLGQEPPVWLAQVAGFGKRAAFHPPELCYVGGHYEVLEREARTVLVNGRPHRLMRLVIGQGQERFEAWYWFTANGRVTHNYYQQQLWLTADAIRQLPGSGTLVRISTPLDSPKSASRRLLAFITLWDAADRS